MQAHENHLRKLLADNQQYLIPLFQRFYVWEKPAWGRLLDDLMELLEDNERGRTHFLGSMVVIPTPAAPWASPGPEERNRRRNAA